MADKKISQLPELTNSNGSQDFLPIVDVIANRSKRVKPNNLPLSQSAKSQLLPFSSFSISGTIETYNYDVIAENRFSNDQNLQTAYIGTNVTSIGNNAFYNCGNFNNLVIVEGTTSIGNNICYGCTGLKRLVFPDSVQSIGSYAFYDATGLKDIQLPSSITSISQRTFSQTAVESIQIPELVTTIGPGAFRSTPLNSIEVPEGLDSIEINCFRDCFQLTDFIAPSAANFSISSFAFYSCTSLQSFALPENLTALENSSFRFSGLTGITIPDKVASIGVFTFGNCISLTSIKLPDSLTSIGNGAFNGCGSLATINSLATTAPTLGSSVFNGVLATEIHVPRGATASYKAAGDGTLYGGLIIVDDL